ncbi:CdaR family transcriptional regulator [Bifidobacterium cuniculi]|uniref:Putative sugar diacid recognition n=1 Tax=Bifidobacterium cuniculi TaxID=1688 RepID=A0A087B3K6_9BIFI|nr:sugar diacid recognition domain-containing protein [Bifidobacterium cuniculi]KFI65606.1 putative sugar diacid recognition [Bifidobacterium cuniculi]
MEIDPGIATTIVANIKDVLRHEINLFDTHGTIIASTDASRIGTEHEAAQIAAATKRTVCVDAEHRYRGARDGINTPVIIDGEVVAVVGVTGRREDVESYGNVIRKMTEILLHENVERAARYNRRIAQANLVHQLVGRDRDLEIIRYLAAELAWDVDGTHRVAIGALDMGHLPLHEADASRYTWPLDRVEHALVTASADECCLILDDAEAARTLEQVRDRLAVCGIGVRFGVSRAAASPGLLPECHRQARRALDWLAFTDDRPIMRAEDLDMGLIVPAMDRTAALSFVDHVFAGLDDVRIRTHRRTFDAYTRFNGSITHAAEALYIHKNTLQNHLNAIAHDTGYNPRVLRDYCVLDMAFRLYDYLQSTAAATAPLHA